MLRGSPNILNPLNPFSCRRAQPQNRAARHDGGETMARAASMQPRKGGTGIPWHPSPLPGRAGDAKWCDNEVAAAAAIGRPSHPTESLLVCRCLASCKCLMSCVRFTSVFTTLLVYVYIYTMSLRRKQRVSSLPLATYVHKPLSWRISVSTTKIYMQYLIYFNDQ